MLRRRRLSSGVRLGPPLPMRLLNKLGPAGQVAGHVAEHRHRAPDAGDRAQVQAHQLDAGVPARAAAAGGRLQQQGRRPVAVRRSRHPRPVPQEHGQCPGARGSDRVAIRRSSTSRSAGRCSCSASRAPARRCCSGSCRCIRAPATCRSGRATRPIRARSAITRAARTAAIARPRTGCEMLELGGARVQQDPSHRDRRSGGVLPPLPQPLPGPARLRLRQCAELLALVGRPARMPTPTACTSASCRRCSGSNPTGIGC